MLGLKEVKLHLGTTWALKQLEKGQMNKLFLLLLKWKHINLIYTKPRSSIY